LQRIVQINGELSILHNYLQVSLQIGTFDA
jgi:hypothetical protein